MLLLLGGQETANSIPNSEFLLQMNDKVFYYKFLVMEICISALI